MMHPVKSLILEAWLLGMTYGRDQDDPTVTAEALLRLLDRVGNPGSPEVKPKQGSNLGVHSFTTLFNEVVDLRSTPESLVASLSCENYRKYNADIVRFRHLRQADRLRAAKSYIRGLGW